MKGIKEGETRSGLYYEGYKILKEKRPKNPDVSACIIAGYHKMDGRNNQYVAENTKVERITGIYDEGDKKHQAGSIYHPEGLSPTLTTMSNGGSKQPFILIKDGTKKGYTESEHGDSINLSYQNSTTKRGRVGKQVAHTIMTASNMAVVENMDKPIRLNRTPVSVQDRIYDTDGISPTVLSSNFRGNIAEKKMYNPYNDKEITDISPIKTTACSSTNSSSTVLISEDGKYCMRIRKLTPLECWRLMRI